MYPDHRASAPPGERQLARDVAASHRALRNDALRVAGGGLIIYLGMLLMVGFPTLISWLTGAPPLGPDVRLVRLTQALMKHRLPGRVRQRRRGTGRGVSCGWGYFKFAYHCTREGLGRHRPRLRRRLRFCFDGRLRGGVVRLENFLISLALAGVGAALSLVAVSATPQNSRNLAALARRLRTAELSMEADRYEKLGARWLAMSDLANLGWNVRESIRWWALMHQALRSLQDYVAILPTCVFGPSAAHC
jgi:hypothetical protein